MQEIVRRVFRQTVCDTYFAQRLAVSRSKAANRLELRAVLQTALAAGFVQLSCFDPLGQHFLERLEIDSVRRQLFFLRYQFSGGMF